MTDLKVNKTIKIAYTKKAKEVLKTNEKIKNLMLDLKDHFKQKNAWGLNYHIYLDMTKLDSFTFNAILTLKKYEIYYDENKCSLMIKRKKK